MRRFDKKQNMNRANLLAEQRHIESKVVPTNELYDVLSEQDLLNEINFEEIKTKAQELTSKYLPKVKDTSEEAIKNARGKIAQAYGFGVEQWNDEGNQKKVQSLYNKLKDGLHKIMSAGVDVIKDPKKLSALLTTLKFAQYGSLIKGVWDIIFVSDVDINVWEWDATLEVGGIFYLKLAIFLFAIRVVLGIIGGSITLQKVLSNIGGYIKNLISIFTGGSSVSENTTISESVDDMTTVEESVILLFKTYGYK